MFRYYISIVLVLFHSDANAHLLKSLLHNLHDKYHNKIYTHYGAGRYPPPGPPPSNDFGQLPPYSPPPYGFPPMYPPIYSPHHSNCHSCNYPYPSAGQLPYPAYNPHTAANYPQMPFGSPNTININNVNAQSQQDSTSVSSHPTSIATNVDSHLNIPHYPIASNGPHHSTDSSTNSQTVFGGNQAGSSYGKTQPHDPSNAFGTLNNNANSNTAIGSNPNVRPIKNEYSSAIGNNMNNLNGPTTSNYGNEVNEFTNFLNGASALLNTISTPATIGTTSVSSVTNTDNGKFDIDIRFGDNDKRATITNTRTG